MNKKLHLILTIYLLMLTYTSIAQHANVGTPQIYNQVNCDNMVISPDATYMLSTKRFGIGIQVWNKIDGAYKQGDVIGDYGNARIFPQRFGISNDGNRFVVYNTDFSVWVFDRETDGSFKKTQIITLDDVCVFLQFSPDNKFLLLGNHGKKWLFKNEKELVEIKDAAFKDVHGLPLFIPTTHLLLTGEYLYELSKEGVVTQVQEMKKIEHSSLQFFYMDHVVSSHNGTYLVVQSEHDLSLLERKGNSYVLLSYSHPDEEFNMLSFSADDKYIAGGEQNGMRSKTLIYDINDGKLEKVKELASVGDDVSFTTFTNDGKYLVTGTSSDMYVYPVTGINSKLPTGREVVKDKPKPKKENTEPKVQPVTDNPPVINNTINIFWLSPNPDILDDKPVVTDKPSIEVQIKIIGNKPINQDDIKILINGKSEQKAKFNEVSLKQKSAVASNSYEYTYIKTVQLPTQENLLQVVCGGKVSDQKVKVVYNAGKPSLHILSIGTSLDLEFPKKDAQDFATLFANQGGKEKLFANVTTKTLIGKDATTNAIKEAIEYYKYEYKSGSISPNDIILVFISSHGFMYQNKFRIQGDDYKEMYKETYSVAYDEIVSRLNEVDCKKLIFLDACFSGGAKATTAEINDAIIHINQQHNGTTTLSSCSNDEYSYEDESWNNGAFTKAIVQGCSTAAADADNNGIITIGELYNYIKGTVPKMVMDKKQKSQHPTMPVTDLLENTAVYVREK